MESIKRFIFVLSILLFNNHLIADTFRISSSKDNLFPLSIIHVNDIHAKFEEFNIVGSTCKVNETCIGGYARAVTVIKELQKTQKNPIYLNAGDNFQGSLWYTLGGWNVTSYFLNLLKADAITLGNHEFDRGIAGVVPFMEHLDSPVVDANIDDSDEPTFQGKYRKSIVIERNNRKIGIIGAIRSTTNEIADTENLRFYNESGAIRREASLMQKQGVDIIIVLSHCGLDADYLIARETASFVDVIVGGHSHKFMYALKNGEKLSGPDKPLDKYPAVVESEDGHKVLIVQASAFMKYVGDLVVYFDEAGRVVSWEGNPIFLDTNIKQDPQILAELQPWKKIIDEKGERVIGHAKNTLEQQECRKGECSLGNFIADAFRYSYSKPLLEDEVPLNDSIIVFINSGGLRTAINAGAITFGDLVMTIPFENSIDSFDMRGDHLKEVFEFGVTSGSLWDTWAGPRFLQISGARAVYDVTKKPQNRVVSIEVMTIKDNITSYEPLDLNKMYKCVTLSYLIEGGDSFHVISKYLKNHKVGLIDINIVEQYLQDFKVIDTGVKHRIKIIS